MGWTVALAERSLVPTSLVRMGIRQLLERRLRDEARRHADRATTLREWTRTMERSPIAVATAAANAQHYEVPAAFFELVLGRRLKYSAAHFPNAWTTLDEAEEIMLALTCLRAGVADGQKILELGCGWGSLTLWMAEQYPTAAITAVSNSTSQRGFILGRAQERGLRNVTVITADANTLHLESKFDRVVSVEMFEHIRNWGALLRRIDAWLEDDGAFFQHVFAHARYAYPFETTADDDWMGRHFFTGGMMPTVDLLDFVESPLVVAERNIVAGTHYARTAEAWLRNLDARREEVLGLFGRSVGRHEAALRLGRWRVFFLACAELFAFDQGTQWVVTHSLLRKRARASA